MATTPKSVIYFPSDSNTRYMRAPLLFMFFGTLFYSMSINDHFFGAILFYMSFIYPLVLLQAYLQRIPKWNNLELGPEGVTIHRFIFKNQFFSWKSIKSFHAPGLGTKSLVIGIEYNQPPKFTIWNWWRQQGRKRMFGYYDLIPNSYDTGDKDLFRVLVQWHRKYEKA